MRRRLRSSGVESKSWHARTAHSVRSSRDEVSIWRGPIGDFAGASRDGDMGAQYSEKQVGDHRLSVLMNAPNARVADTAREQDALMALGCAMRRTRHHGAPARGYPRRAGAHCPIKCLESRSSPRSCGSAAHHSWTPPRRLKAPPEDRGGASRFPPECRDHGSATSSRWRTSAGQAVVKSWASIDVVRSPAWLRRSGRGSSRSCRALVSRMPGRHHGGVAAMARPACIHQGPFALQAPPGLKVRLRPSKPA